ncbi:MAG: NHLP leader peptide family RiPP precursor [Vicinamibacterales bacterium]
MSEDTPTPMTRHDLETLIVKRCWENEAFHQEFVADPAACFVKYLNVPRANVPAITVHDEAPGTWHIVIPAKPTTAGELSDEELEKVAGGTDWFITAAVVTAAVGFGVTTIGAATMATVGGTLVSAGVGTNAGWGK